MKKIPCAYDKCSSRRIHFTLPNEERGTQLVEVEDDYEGKAYCSLTCAILDGAMSAKHQPQNSSELSAEKFHNQSVKLNTGEHNDGN